MKWYNSQKKDDSKTNTYDGARLTSPVVAEKTQEYAPIADFRISLEAPLPSSGLGNTPGGLFVVPDTHLRRKSAFETPSPETAASTNPQMTQIVPNVSGSAKAKMQSVKPSDSCEKAKKYEPPRKIVKKPNSPVTRTTTSDNKNNAKSTPISEQTTPKPRPTKSKPKQKDRKRSSSKPKPTKTDDINRLLKNNTQEWMANLTADQRRAFENLFDRIDTSDSGGITRAEIINLVRRQTNKQLTPLQVNDVLTNLDVKRTGDIEFDEFIFMLSQPANFIRLIGRDDLQDLTKVNKEKSTVTKFAQTLIRNHQIDPNDPTEVFFMALRNATRADSMTALRSFYRNRLKKLNDHVIHDWSAGQRCIGLSDHEMLKRYETIQGELLRQRVNFCKDNSYKASPYARPLEWGLLTLREAIDERKNIILQKKAIKPVERRVKLSEFVVTPKVVPLPKYAIKKRSPLKRTFNYDQLADIREKVDKIANTYYGDLKNVANDNSQIVKKELAVDDIKVQKARQNFTLTFRAYCAPFVVSPWIPMPSPTLQASLAPLGKPDIKQKSW